MGRNNKRHKMRKNIKTHKIINDEYLIERVMQGDKLVYRMVRKQDSKYYNSKDYSQREFKKIFDRYIY
jgi:hypothetical protein